MSLNINIHVTVGLSDEVKGWIMSQLSDATAAFNQSLDAATLRVTTDVDDLKAEVVRLQALIDSGQGSAAEVADAEAALVAGKARLDALDPTNAATLPKSGMRPPVGAVPKHK